MTVWMKLVCFFVNMICNLLVSVKDCLFFDYVNVSVVARVCVFVTVCDPCICQVVTFGYVWIVNWCVAQISGSHEISSVELEWFLRWILCVQMLIVWDMKARSEVLMYVPIMNTILNSYHVPACKCWLSFWAWNFFGCNFCFSCTCVMHMYDLRCLTYWLFILAY